MSGEHDCSDGRVRVPIVADHRARRKRHAESPWFHAATLDTSRSPDLPFAAYRARAGKSDGAWAKERRVTRLKNGAGAIVGTCRSQFRACARDRCRPVTVLLLLVALALSACAGHNAGGDGSADGYTATIRRTSYGIPHIVARDMGSLGFGEGHAFAEDHLCSLADQVVRARGERARYFGRGDRDQHLNSDITVTALRVFEGARRNFEEHPPAIQEWLHGYAAGYNKYLAETGVANLRGWCRGQPYVMPITAVDVLARGRLGVLAAAQFVSQIATAAPPGAATRAAVVSHAALDDAGTASNAWAIGSARSESGRGMLLANPHWFWTGAGRFWEKHLTIPGQLDVYGVNTLGLPGVGIGFTRHIGWTFTVSAGRRITLYTLTLVPGDPTSYLYDGTPRKMSARTVTLEVREPDGSLARVERAVYFSHYGPILNYPGFEWTRERALTYRDANANYGQGLLWLLAMNRARSLDQLKKAHADFGGTTFLNTIAASDDGRAWYADTASAPNLSPTAVAAWGQRLETDAATKAMDARGMILLDGSDSRFEWVNERDPRGSGVVPYAKAPQLERRDYVFNANDSYWMPHAVARLTGFSPVHGRERTARSLRTRMNVLMLSDTTSSGPSGPDGRFSLGELMAAAFANRGYAAELLLPQVVARCAARGSFVIDGQTVDLGPACRVLAAYNGRLDAESQGAVLWREFITQFEFGDQLRAGPLFAEEFDPEDPVNTPRRLAPASGERDAVLERLARAAKVLGRAGISLDTPLGRVQYAERAGRRIPIHGGQGGWEGVLNFVNLRPNLTTLEPSSPLPPRIEGSRFLRAEGYPITGGTSFIMTLEFTDSGPRAQAVLTYSQSGDSGSPHYLDQTELFSAKRWRPILFTEAEIRADPKLSVTIVRGARPR